MSDQPRPLPEPTPEQERAVTRLLAEARHDEPLPPDVAARLDEALAELSHADLEHVADPDDARVVDLVSHRRRRRDAGRLLLAAAALIIVGVGVGQVIGNGQDSSSDSAATGKAIDRGSGSDSVSAPAAESSGEVAPIELTGSDPTALAAQLSSQLAADGVAVPSAPGTALSPAQQRRFLDRAAGGYRCAAPTAGAYGAGELLPAYLDGQAVVLALRPSAAGSDAATTQADVLECGTGAAVTTFTVTLP